MATQLTDQDLVDMQSNLMRWSRNTVHRDVFRGACGDLAARIGAYLAERGNEAALAQKIEDLFGRAAPAEVARVQRLEELCVRMCAAHDAGDARSWCAAFKPVVDLLSESSATALMLHVARLDAASDLIEADLVNYHEAPRALQ